MVDEPRDEEWEALLAEHQRLESERAPQTGTCARRSRSDWFNTASDSPCGDSDALFLLALPDYVRR